MWGFLIGLYLAMIPTRSSGVATNAATTKNNLAK